MIRIPIGRSLLLGVVLIVLNLLKASPSAAQASIEVEQSVSWNYGENLTFTVRAQAPTSLVGARLFVQIPDQSPVYQADVPVDGGNVDASHSATVQALGVPPAALIQYYWEFVDATGQTYKGESSTAMYADNRVPWEWTSTREASLTIFTDGRSASLGQSALRMAEAGRDSAAQLLGSAPEGEITVFVYPDLTSLANSLRAHNLNVQDWVAAYSIPSTRTIFVAAESGPHLMASLDRDIRHEVTHLAIAATASQHAESIPGWFTEGLAIYNSGERDPGLTAAVNEGVAERTLLPVSALCITSYANLPPREAALAYGQSLSLVDFIIERYGSSQIASLMNAYREGQNCEQAVQSVLGLNLAELENQWLRHLSASETSSAVSANPSVWPWLAGWIASIILALLFTAPQPPRTAERSAVETKVSLPPVRSDAP